ncbi:MAG: TIGR03619 family F420-dependent LLM class oxidoreductase [Acidimicrobiia bacterium]
MKLGLFGLNSGGVHAPEDTLRLAAVAEEIGFDSWWVGEHVVLPSPRVAPAPMEPTDPILDPLVHLAFVAAATTRIELGTGIIILPQRNPVVLAKQVASLDVLAGGRLHLGIGVGYLEPEMSAVGVPMAQRGERTDDYLAAMRALWRDPGPVAHDGPFVSFSGVDAHPRPTRPGGPPIVIGGRTPPAHRRAVAVGHGWYGFFLTPAQAAAQVQSLRRAAGVIDRPAELGALEISITPPPGPISAELADEYRDAGVDRLIAYPLPLANADDVERALHQIGTLIE